MTNDPRRGTIRAERPVMAPGLREREKVFARRSWTPAERRVVLNGLFGRVLIAIEPIICFLVFGTLTGALIFFPLPKVSKLTHWESAIILAPIFGLAALAFLTYAAVLLVPPLRALVATFAPIYIVDGYVRYRQPDSQTEADSNGYVAVLSEDRHVVAEWPCLGENALTDSERPALIEFSHYGGIHRIDGRSTGVVPASMPALGIGNNVPHR